MLAMGAAGSNTDGCECWANVDICYRSRYRFWLLLVVRYVKRRNECWLLCSACDSTGSLAARAFTPTPPNPTRTYANPPWNCEGYRKKDETNTASSQLTRLPRPRRPPPRHVLRQAGGPEGRSSWSDLEEETTEEEEEELEVERRERQEMRKQCGDMRNGRRKRVELVLSSLQRIEEARCTYTATPSKRMILGEVWSSSISSRSLVSARKWRLVLFFCTALFRVPS